ncbi:hypothetical protein N431DRAFT_432125 [Stipitochalara longipes BDJ]|nr:hypothetical protein N431DRAFT_432125 [Stipitochalara longipes BDJ]
MTLTFCLQSCQLYAFAGVYGMTYFCSNSFPSPIPTSDSETGFQGQGIYDLPCPGNSSQVCGGGGSVGAGGFEGRDVSEGVSLTTYQNSVPVVGVRAVGNNGTVVTFQGGGGEKPRDGELDRGFSGWAWWLGLRNGK